MNNEMHQDILASTGEFPIGIADQVRRARIELPAGSGSEQLRNFCGRVWEIIHTPAFDTPLLVNEVFGSVSSALEQIIAQGIHNGEFRPGSASAAARVVTASLLGQGVWCNQAEISGPGLNGNCARVVSETLSLVLGGLVGERRGARKVTEQ
jgi:hypothetical protein